MKHLKTFNEAVTQDNIELCCVDLFDDGFELKYSRSIPHYNNNLISLQKRIVSYMPEWDGTPGTDVRGDIIWEEHLSKYQPGTITITGDNFDKVETTFRQKLSQFKNEQVPLSEDEKELVSKVGDIASVLSNYSGVKTKGKKVEIQITSGPYQNPMNFQYDRYRTIINIFIYL